MIDPQAVDSRITKCLVIDNNEFNLTVSDGYDSLVRFVGGPLEAIRISSDAVAYVHEEGKLIGLPLNVAATKFLDNIGVYRNGMLQKGDFIVGPMVVLGCISPDGEWDGEEYDVPAGLVAAAVRFSRKQSTRKSNDADPAAAEETN